MPTSRPTPPRPTPSWPAPPSLAASPVGPSPSGATDVVVHRPTWGHFARVAKGRLLPALALLVVCAAAGGLGSLWIIGPLVLGLSAGFALYLRTAAVTVSTTSLSYSKLGRTTTVRLDGRQTGLLCMLQIPAGQLLATAAVRSGDGRRIALSEAYFDKGTLHDVASRCGLHVLPVDVACTPRQVQELAPGALSFPHRRPVVTALIVVSVALPVAAVAVLLTV